MFQHQVYCNANLTVTADLLYVGGNLFITGNQVIVGSSVYDTDITPLTTGRLVGNATNQFDGNFRNMTIYNSLIPSANNKAFGNTISRWDTYSVNVNASGTLTVLGATSVSTIVATGATQVQNTLATGNTTVTGFVNVSSSANVGGTLSVVGTSALTGNVVVTANVTSNGFILPNSGIYSNVKTVTTLGNSTVDAFPKALSNSTKLIVSVDRLGTSIHMVEVLLIHDGTNVLTTTYGEIFNNSLGTFDAAINNANVEIYFSPTTANTYTVRTIRQNLT